MKKCKQIPCMLLLLLMLLFSAPHAQARYYALCVGVSEYPRPATSLRVSANDARVMKRLLDKSIGASVSLVTDRKATCKKVLETLSATCAKAGKNDIVVFFFSGHGTADGFACYDGVLPFGKMLTVLKHCKASKKLIFADACLVGSLRHDQAWQSTFQGEKVMFFLSSRSAEASYETPFSNSLFTIYLERGLRGGADVNKDRTITARELYDFVHTGVIADSNGDQHPVMWGKFNAKMPVVKWKKNNNKNKN